MWFVPGWDCHGLPIELKVLQSLKSKERSALTPIDLRRKAAEFAKETVDAQRTSFQRYGVWADWQKPYLTLQPEYEAAQLRVFSQMVLKGHIYRGFKPVYWSPSSRTALAEAELEYPAGHESPSVYAAFDVVPESAASCIKDHLPLRVAVWTTTPWTLPANLAVAVNARLEYCVAEHTADAGEEGEAPASHGRIVIARELVGALEATLGGSLKVLATFKGEELADGTKYVRPLADLDANGIAAEAPVVVGGEYITADGGTGLVHTAPGHGADDFVTGAKAGLEGGAFSPVDDAGRFTAEAGERFKGLQASLFRRRLCNGSCGEQSRILRAAPALSRSLHLVVSARLLCAVCWCWRRC